MKWYLIIMLLFTGCSGSNVTVTPTPDLRGEPGLLVITPTRDSLAITIDPTGTPEPTSEPLRVQFLQGSYGAIIEGIGDQSYMLWARAGQDFILAFSSGENCQARLHFHAKTENILNPRSNMLMATLGDTGDHVLGIRCDGDYIVSVGIQ